MTQHIVDAVITWVDGHDPMHQDKLLMHLKKLNIECPKSVAAPTRFNQCGEIDYCIQSILKFAPWIRTLFIVTDSQIPPIMQQFKGTPFEARIKLIDHRDIFAGYEQALPTFNSVTIESMLWRIKGLSEHFIYFNDDCFLIRPVVYDDFFRNNKIVLRGHWKLASNHKVYALYHGILSRLGKRTKTNIHRAAQENSAHLAGINHYFFHLPHVPFPLKKSIFQQFFSLYPAQLQHNIQFSFRDAQQFLPVSLAYHLALNENNAVIDPHLKAIGISGDRYSLPKIKKLLLGVEKKKAIAFMCVQSMDMASQSVQHFLNQWMMNILKPRENN
jgi:hypothetical protein